MSTNEKTDLNLLEEFAPSDYAAWKTAAEALLKGAPFEKKMLTPTPEGITFQPIYRSEDIEGLEHLQSFPGDFNFVRGAREEGYLKEPWKIAQELPYGTPEEFNKIALGDLMRGQDALNITLDMATQIGLDPADGKTGEVAACGLSLACIDDLNTALKDIVPDAISISFQSGLSGLPLFGLLLAWLKKNGKEASALNGGMNLDPLGILAKSGTLPISLEDAFADMATLAKYCSENAPHFTAVGVSTLPYANAGASAVEELGCALATGVTYLRKMMEAGMEIDAAAKSIAFEFSLGANFFMEVAKLRAARILWGKAVEAFGGSREAARMKVHARTGLWNKTVHDPYVNMLRTTTEALSGVVGGVDSMHVGPFDEVIGAPTEFSRRIARNTQIILQEECELRAVVDPAGGSWFIEKLTDEVAKTSWSFFQDIEKAGGMIAALESGMVQEKVAKTQAGRKKMLAQRRANLVGTNLYPNLGEKPLNTATPDFEAQCKARKAKVRAKAELSLDKSGDIVSQLAAAATSGATLGSMFKALHAGGGTPSITALPNERGAKMFEEMRAAAKAAEPKLFLSTIGPLRKHKARADFTSGFFQVGGFDITAAPGTTDVDEAVKLAQDSGAKVTVICGTDDDYVEFVPAFCQKLKAAAPDIKIILAGYPGDNEEAYKAAGLDDYIFVKSNVYDVNKQYLEYLDVL